MNVLITGGTGLIGKVLVTKLIEDGHRVTVLTRSPKKARGQLHPRTLTVKWDGRSATGWGHIIDETDAVINLAGESIAGDSFAAIFTRRWTPAQIKRIRSSRVDAGQALVDAIQAAAKKPRVFIQASAVGYYGPRGDEEIIEDTAGGRDTLARVCREWEVSSSAVEAMGVRRVVIRTGLVLAGGGGILPIMLLPFRLFVGGPLGSGKQVVPWIHIEDEVNAIRFFLQHESSSGAYNLTAPNPVQQRELAKIAGLILKRPSFIPTPGFALKLALGEKATLVLDGQRAIPNRLLDSGYNFKFEELTPALEDLL